MSAARRSTLLRAWVLAVTAVELLGSAAALATGAITAAGPPVVALTGLLVAGGVGGTVLGWGQARVLRRAVPELDVRRWTLRTALAAAASCLLGLLPSLAAPWWNARPPVVIVAATAVLVVLLVSTIGLAQWPLLRTHVTRAWRWTVISAVGRLAGLGVFLAVAMPLWRPDEPAVGFVAVGLLAAVLMALTVAVVTGLGVVGMVGG